MIRHGDGGAAFRADLVARLVGSLWLCRSLIALGAELSCDVDRSVAVVACMRSAAASAHISTRLCCQSEKVQPCDDRGAKSDQNWTAPARSGLFPKSIRSKMAIHADPRLRNKTRSFLDLSTARREVLKVAWVVANGNAP
jgi:hypothetical protein